MKDFRTVLVVLMVLFLNGCSFIKFECVHNEPQAVYGKECLGIADAERCIYYRVVTPIKRSCVELKCRPCGSGNEKKEIEEKTKKRVESKKDKKVEKKKEIVAEKREEKKNNKLRYLDAKLQKATLFVEPNPEGAHIRILNIKPRYYGGIELNSGSYKIEVSKDGYNTKIIEVNVSAGEVKTIAVPLKEKSKAVLPKKVVTSKSVKQKITNNIGQTFVYIQPGTYMMGSPSNEKGRADDEKQHKVTLTKGFYMQNTEVTQGQWKAIMGNNPSYFKDCGDDCPVEEVSWDDVQKFIDKLNQKSSEKKYRLPTEAEWEYAARAGTSTPFNTGGCLSTSEANYDGGYPYFGCSAKGIDRNQTISVGSFSPNKWGLYDMHGNVDEWCQDWDGHYPTIDVIDPTGPPTGSLRVFRGGSWSSIAQGCRSAANFGFNSDYRYYGLGFRLILF